MKKQILIIFILLPWFISAQNKILNEIDSVSYLIGSSFGMNIENNIPEINLDLLIQGMTDRVRGMEPAISDDYDLMITSYFEKKQSREDSIMIANGVKFLDSIEKNTSNIHKTESGLLYEILKSTKGKNPSEKDMVRVHYKGSTPSGEVFDSSYDRGEPVDFILNQVIKGWTEGVQLMTMGSKYKFYIPQELAYGEMAPPGSSIKPYMPLVFEIELIDIIK